MRILLNVLGRSSRTLSSLPDFRSNVLVCTSFKLAKNRQENLQLRKGAAKNTQESSLLPLELYLKVSYQVRIGVSSVTVEVCSSHPFRILIRIL